MPLKLKDDKAVPSNARLISLNTSAFTARNWFTWGQREDLSTELEWFENELKELEEIGGVAVVIGHHNPIAMTQQFGVRFRALMERY